MDWDPLLKVPGPDAKAAPQGARSNFHPQVHPPTPIMRRDLLLYVALLETRFKHKAGPCLPFLTHFFPAQLLGLLCDP